MNKSIVSIIIPVFNRENLIGETLDSVLNQSYQHWECIVVDDGSGDASKQVVQWYVDKDSRFKLFERKRRPKGANTCRNIGFEKSSGELLIFLDSDDILLSHCLEKRLEIFSRLPEMDFLVFPKVYFSQNQIEKPQTDFPPKDQLIERFLSLQPPWQTTSLLLTKESFLKINGFDESLERFQDVDFFIRLLQNTTEKKFEQIDNYSYDFKRRVEHYDKKDYLFEVKVANSLWILIKKQALTLLEKKETKESLISSYKILIFDYLSVQNKHRRTIVFSHFLKKKGILRNYHRLVLVLYVGLSKTPVYRLTGFRYLIRNVLL